MKAMLLVESRLDPARGKHFEGAMTQGNGYVHFRATYEEGLACAQQDEAYMRLPANVTVEKPRHPRSQCCTCVPGLTGRHPLLNEEMVNLPNPLYLTARLDEEPLDMDNSTVEDYQRTLDFSNGMLARQFLWKGQSGTSVACKYERFASMANPHLIVQRATYTALDKPAVLEIRCGIDERVRTNGYQHFTALHKQAANHEVTLALTTDQNDEVMMKSVATASFGEWSVQEGDQCLRVTLEPEQSLIVDKRTLIHTSRDAAVPVLCDSMEWDTLVWQQQAQWKELWKQAEMTIEDDEETQQAINFSIYHLLRCSNAWDDRVAICAKGFSSDAYFGHFFWDSEIYLLPFLLYTLPERGKNLERFRIRTLQGAQRNAAAYGYQGARYPWESSVSGEEQCPNWQYADHEVHVTADVAIGLWHTYCATEDEDFLQEAAPVFVETARYWLDRMTEENDGAFSLKGVMGPDEYICLCDNNAYTNYVVRYALERTLDVMELTGVKDDVLRKKISKAVAKLRCPCDGEGVIAQCDHFDSYEQPNFERFWPDRSVRYAATVSQERNYRTKALKQADLLMIPYLFPWVFSQEQLAENLDYYLPMTTHDSSLSAVVHAILLCRLGRAEEAMEYFTKALRMDLDGEGAAEGVHIANCGGVWQALVFGFAGMNFAYEDDFPTFSPMMPEKWKRIGFRLNYLGQSIRVSIGSDGIAVGEGGEHDA